MVEFSPVELATAAAALVVAMAEVLHARRTRRLARLAFGPDLRPAPWARLAPALRVLSAAAVCWGLATLYTLPPKAHVAESIPDNQRRHVLIVLDVSPSMRLKDAGPNADVSRAKRASDVMESFFQRIPIEMYLMSVVACYNGAKPVVVDTKDMEVVRNIFGDLPLNYAFPAGKTDLFSGLIEAAKIAAPWQPKSTLLLMLTDGDTVPATGMPKLPASIADVLVVGVGDPRAGTFIDGKMSRQDANTLRQIAARLSGTYHDGNSKHLPTELLSRLTIIPRKTAFEQLTRREYALMAIGLGSTILAFLPVFLAYFGTRWRPGVHAGSTPLASRRKTMAVGSAR
ncbi:vWA domain-containing protein [Aquisphaera insulae]|uniref:vWA domain-containing protein n=1 Tax=Aquisphaera insulae TaxID=2712864 RepID=UPI00196B2C0D|nr:vWA domain-containing protein [Aquisphaera insulae]